MHNVQLALNGAWRVLLASLVLGAGLPVLYAVGIRALSMGTSGDQAIIGESGVTAPRSRPAGKLLGGLCFAIVLVAVAVGITFIVATGSGKTISFEHIYPTIVKKH